MIITVLEAYAVGGTIMASAPTYIQEAEILEEPVVIEEVVDIDDTVSVDEPVMDVSDIYYDLTTPDPYYIPDIITVYSVETTGTYEVEYGGGPSYSPYVDNEVITLVGSEEEAQEIADKYGIELISCEYGVAEYDTGEVDPSEFCDNLTEEDQNFELNFYVNLY